MKIEGGGKPVSYFTEWVAYNPTTGKFTWVKTSARGVAGSCAGFSTNRKYLRVSVKGIVVLAHRLAWFIHYGVWPSGEIDHVNGIRSDNRIENLRDVPRRGNGQNRSKAKGVTSKYFGVSWHARDRVWQVSIKLNGKVKYLGSFRNEEQARDAYRDAKKKYHLFQPEVRENAYDNV